MNRIETLIADANHVMNEIAAEGLFGMTQKLDAWKMAAAGYATAGNGYAGRGTGMADWEVILDDPTYGISIILRQYRVATERNDYRRTTRWAIGSDENVSREAVEQHMLAVDEARDKDMSGSPRPGERACHRIAKAHNSQPSIEQVAREGVNTDDMTYEEWDAMRRRLLTTLDDYDNVRVEHREHETAVYYGPAGMVIATWSQATGQCRLRSPNQIAEALADMVRNYVMNAMRYSTTTISELRGY